MSILETKAVCPELERARELIAGEGAIGSGSAKQHDIYFHARRGWLKLRGSELIAYSRDVGPATRVCTYTIIRVGDPIACAAGLTAVLGIHVEVRKLREKWTLGSTTVHLDDVEGLGRFVELETPSDRPACHQRCLDLLGLDATDDLRASYADLIVAARPAVS